MDEPDLRETATPVTSPPHATQPNDFDLGGGFYARAEADSVSIFHVRGAVRVPWNVWCAAVSNMEVFHAQLNVPTAAVEPAPDPEPAEDADA